MHVRHVHVQLRQGAHRVQGQRHGAGVAAAAGAGLPQPPVRAQRLRSQRARSQRSGIIIVIILTFKR